MTDLWDIRLVGSLETLSPFCVIPPSADEVTRADGSKFRRISRRTIYQDGLRESRPVVPGSTLRGRLRRSAVEVVRGMTGDRVPLAQWHQNAIGGIKGSESEASFDVQLRINLREKNPVLALFGAGSPWMISRASISDAIPEGPVETDLIGGARSDDGRRDGSFFEKLDADALEQWHAMANANSARTRYKKAMRELNATLRAARKNGSAEEVARLEAELGELAKREETVGLLSTNPVSMPLQHEAIPAGVRMQHRITLSAVTAAEAGLFIAAMNHWMKSKPALGQHESLGYGLLRGEYDAYLSPARSDDPFAIGQANAVSLGTMIAEPVSGLSCVPERFVEFMSAFREAFQQGAFDFRLASEIGTQAK
ncbi:MULTISPECIES: hypothetical protein [Paracoccus]|uniref:hypothetical protein n=1 Tax=Paracoccus TaxID=265 RepID=UPI001FB822C2|nr:MULTISPECIES: hypothetical protein [Paracoccus]MCJ1902141.1 hypothetical protein [Paracoccus versutus]MDF3906835.1 hypothetical protein [Paracoccus sp. AS002]